MPQNPLERWRPPAEYYSHLVDRARAHDPRVIVGVASPAETARMEREVERLEKEAKAKAAKALDFVKQRQRETMAVVKKSLPA